jgi:hypothetical protein
MPFEELRPLSLVEVKHAIWNLSCEFRVSSEEFLSKGGDALGVPYDAAMEWHFLLLQKAALEADYAQPRYQGVRSNVRPETVDESDALIRLAA